MDSALDGSELTRGAPVRLLPEPAPPTSRGFPQFPALDGVRALAILGVLAAHTGLPGVAGGFVGVDLFFVLSGFLITSLLLAERGAAARLDLPGFWARRARRLLPGALLMICGVIFARSLLAPDATADLRADAIRACVWLSNWRWSLQGTDYFGQGGTGSPLQHTWSLSVEEQFYVVWPCVLLLVWRSARTWRGLRRRLWAVAVGGVGVSAATTAVLGRHASQGRLYFGTDTRAQELLVGAVLAAALAPTWQWAAQRRRAVRSPQRVARRPLPALLSVCGLLGLVLLVHLADGSRSELRHGLLLLVAALSALLIAGCVLDGRHAVARLMAARPLRWLGRISYGVYLWHWPVFEVLDGPRTGLGMYPLAVLRIVCALTCGCVSTVVLEAPARRIRLPSRRVLQVAVLSVAGALTFAACAAPETSPVKTSATAPSTTLDAPPSTSEAADHSPGPSRHLRRGGRVVDIFGDSIGWTLGTYLPATPGFDFANRTVLGCGVVRGGPYRYFGEQYGHSGQCDAWPSRWRAQLLADRPDDALLVVGRWETMDRVYRGGWTHVGEPAFDAYLQGLLSRAVDLLASTGAHVIVTTEPYNRRGTQPDGQLYPEDVAARVDAWNAIVRRVVAARAGVRLLDLNRKLGPGGRFTWTVDGLQVRSDGVHLTPEGVRWLTPWLLAALRRA